MSVPGPTRDARRRLARLSGDGGQPRTGSDEAAQLRRLVAMFGRLSVVASQQPDLAAVAQFLAQSTGSRVAVLDRGLDVLAAGGTSGAEDVVATLRENVGTGGLNAVLAAAVRNRRALTVPAPAGDAVSIVVAPVSVGDDVAAYLVAIGADDEGLGEDMLLLASEHAAMVCGILLGRELVVAAAAGKARRDLVEALLLARGNDDGEADRWARHLGFDDSREHAVLAASLAEDAGAADYASVESTLIRLAPDAIVTTRTDEVVAVVPSATAEGSAVERARRLASQCVADAGRRTPRVSAVGVGNPCRSPAGISRSYTEARHALAAAARIGEPGSVALFADLGIHRLLVRFPDVAELRAFAHEVLGRLVEEEQATGMEYLATLAVYFEENSSPSRAAQRLHVHPNTVSYRIRRVEEITGLSLDVHRDRLMVAVAVEILEGLGHRR